jgi:hypothetical protein
VLLDALTIQKGVYALGFDPGPRDGKSAVKAVADAGQVQGQITRAGTCTQGDNTWACSHLEITPEPLAIMIRAGASRYEEVLAANQAVPRTSAPIATPSVTTTMPGPDAGSLMATGLPFWRMDNTWAWAAAGIPLAALLGGLGWWFYRRGG